MEETFEKTSLPPSGLWPGIASGYGVFRYLTGL
jgi:hypothetical protein